MCVCVGICSFVMNQSHFSQPRLKGLFPMYQLRSRMSSPGIWVDCRPRKLDRGSKPGSRSAFQMAFLRGPFRYFVPCCRSYCCSKYGKAIPNIQKGILCANKGSYSGTYTANKFGNLCYFQKYTRNPSVTKESIMIKHILQILLHGCYGD